MKNKRIEVVKHCQALQVPDSSEEEEEATELPASPQIRDEARGETLSVVVVDHDGSAVGQNSYLLGMRKKPPGTCSKLGFHGGIGEIDPHPYSLLGWVWKQNQWDFGDFSDF